MRFVISFLQHALFEQFSTTAAEDSTLLRNSKVRNGDCGLERKTALTHGMEMAIRFRARRREVLQAAIARMQGSINAARAK